MTNEKQTNEEIAIENNNAYLRYSDLLSRKSEELAYVTKLAEMSGCLESAAESIKALHNQVNMAIKMCWRTQHQTTDLQNRREIERKTLVSSEYGNLSHEKIMNELLGRKLHDLIKSYSSSMNPFYFTKRAKRIRNSADKMLGKMYDRTMTEEEYDYLRYSTPRQLRREFGGRK